MRKPKRYIVAFFHASVTDHGGAQPVFARETDQHCGFVRCVVLKSKKLDGSIDEAGKLMKKGESLMNTHWVTAL